MGQVQADDSGSVFALAERCRPLIKAVRQPRTLARPTRLETETPGAPRAALTFNTTSTHARRNTTAFCFSVAVVVLCCFS